MDFRFCEEFPQPVSEPDICVTRPVTALKFLRNFGHLITNLHVEYFLFHMLEKSRDTKFCKIVEHYMAEYCSESLRQISLKGDCSLCEHIILEDIHKTFVNVKIVHTEQCAFGDVLPFNRVFPNLQTLKLGFNIYNNRSAIRVQFNSLESLWFFDYIYLRYRTFEEEDIVEMFKLNSQLQNAVIYLHFHSNLIARIQEYCPDIKLVRGLFPHIGSFFNFEDFVYKLNRGDRITFTGFTETYPIKISDEYKIALQDLFDFYCTWKG